MYCLIIDHMFLTYFLDAFGINWQFCIIISMLTAVILAVWCWWKFFDFRLLQFIIVGRNRCF